MTNRYSSGSKSFDLVSTDAHNVLQMCKFPGAIPQRPQPLTRVPWQTVLWKGLLLETSSINLEGLKTASQFTLFFVIAPTIIGQTIPDKVPTPLEIPIKMLAYLGAISKWLTLNPAIQRSAKLQTEAEHFCSSEK